MIHFASPSYKLPVHHDTDEPIAFTPSEGTHLSLILLNTSFILSYCMHYFILYIVTLYRFPKLGVGIKQRFFSPLLYETTWV